MKEMKFDDKLISSEIVFKGKLLTIQKKILKNGEGLVYEREVIKRPDAVAVVALVGEDVLLVKQYRAALDMPLLELPAGIIEDCSPEETAHKELIEETGHKAGSLKLMNKFYSSVGYTNELIYIYEASDLVEVAPDPEEEEIIEIIKMPIKEAVDGIKSGKIVDAKTIIGLLLAGNEQ